MVVAEKQKTGIKLVELELENFKRLNVKQHFDEDTKSVTVSGKNGVGKSTFIDSLFILLTGKEIPSEPIQKGKTKGSIQATLKDEEATYIAKLEFSKDSNGNVKRSFTLRVDEVLHKKQTDARKLLENKIGSLYFDVFDFINMQPREQKVELQKILNLDFSDLEGKKAGLLQDKLECENKRKSLEDQLNELPYDDSGEVYTKQDSSGILAELNEARDLEAKKIKIEDSIANYKNTIGENEMKINDLMVMIEKLKSQNNELHDLAAELVKERDAITVPDIEAIRKKAESLDENNRKADIQAKFKELVELKTAVEDSIGEILDKIKSVEKERIDRIAKVKLPVEGLGFSDDGLTYNGLPLDESAISSGELIELGSAIAVGLNPHLKIMRVKDASLLDDEHLQAVQKVADQHGFMVFYEKVGNTKELGIQFNEV